MIMNKTKICFMAKYNFIYIDMDIDVQTPEDYAVVSLYSSFLLQWDPFPDLLLPAHGRKGTSLLMEQGIKISEPHLVL